MIRRPPRSTLDRSSAASDVYKRQGHFNQKKVNRQLFFQCKARKKEKFANEDHEQSYRTHSIVQESPPRAAETNSYGQERSSRTAVTNSLRRKGQIHNQSNIKNPKF